MKSKIKYRLVSFCLFLMFFGLTIAAQESDSLRIIENDNEKQEKIIKKSKKRQSPALVASITIVVPGYGQVYNRKYWKLPIIYGALGGMIYLTSNNQELYRSFRDDYLHRLNEGTETKYPNLQDDTVKILRDKYRKKMELSYIWTVGVLIIQSLDALVDTHLYNFDVSEDISINLFERTTPSEFQDFPLVSFAIKL